MFERESLQPIVRQAMVLFRERRVAQAIELLSSVLTDATPTGAFEAWFNLGGMLVERAQDDEAAVAVLDRALSIHPHHPKALMARAAAHQRLGHQEQALADLDAHEGVASADLMGCAERLLLLEALGRADLVERECNRALEIDSTAAFFLATRADLFMSQRRWAEALADYNRIFEHHPEAQNLFLNRGRVRAELGDRVGAREDWLAALRVAEENEDSDQVEEARALLASL